MPGGEKQQAAEDKQPQNRDRLQCGVCGGTMKAGVCSWREDDDVICCRECRVETESCGCSDDCQ